MSKPSTVWKLKKAHEIRFRAGHPWVFSNELAVSPKGLEPGAPVELRDSRDAFLAYGYGNPASLIAFRAVSREADERDALSEGFFSRRLRTCLESRLRFFDSSSSFRLCFGEADSLPGLVIDRYVGAHGGDRVFAVQLHTAGMDRARAAIEAAIVRLEAGKATVVFRNESKVRKLEGLAPEPARLAASAAGDPRALAGFVARVGGLQIRADLFEGQKTGLFLDQTANQRLAASLFHRLPVKRVLDLCSYVGQWGATAAQTWSGVHVTAVDASDAALAHAKANVEAQGGEFAALKGDVLEPAVWSKLRGGHFDLVICDPPAFVKSKRDLGPGKHAYTKLNAEAMRVLKRGGGLVSCSCSAQLSEADLAEVLTKAQSRAGVSVQWIGRGAMPADHPVSSAFPEGNYLKSWLGIKTSELKGN